MHTAEEGFKTIGLGEEALAAILDKHGLSRVAIPEPWAEDLAGGVDLFTREGFFGLLEASPLVEADAEGGRGHE